MLQFIIGKAGTGKTTLLEETIAQKVSAGERCLLIVPEQASFTAERRLYRKIGGSSALNLEVLSITRLCNNIFRQFGGLAGVALDETAKYMLMAVAVNELQGTLKTYRKSSSNFSFLQTLISTISEFKSAGITPDLLKSVANNIENINLQQKLEDMLLVYTAYQALIENGYSDPEDSTIKAVTILENNNFFGDYNMFIDGFTTFMAGEYELIKHIIRQSPAVYAALTTDNLQPDEYGVFSVVKQTGRKLKGYAKDHSIQISEPIILSSSVKFDNPELIKLSQDYMSLEAESYESAAENIKIIPCNTPYSEIVSTAAEISRLVREEELKYKEIAVISRNVEGYQSLFNMEFTRYNIPYFMDKRIEIKDSPIALGIISALECITNNFAQESLLSLAKSPIMGIGIEESSYLENYAYTWQISGSKWQHEFSSNPRGLVDDFSDADKQLLALVNDIRIRIVKPILKLKKDISAHTGRAFAHGVYCFLTETNTAQNLYSYSDQLPKEERDQFIDLNASVYDKIVDITDIFARIINNTRLDAQKLSDLFRLAISSVDLGVLPQTLDHVIVGGADRIRPENIKVAFVIGANEGSFPPPIVSTGVFSAKERDILNESGLEIGGSGIYQSLLENFYTYFALTVPSSKLYISYSENTNKGDELFPSSIIAAVEDIFLDIKKEAPTQGSSVQNLNSAVVTLAENYKQDTPLRATLVELIAKEDEGTAKKLEGLLLRQKHKLFDDDNIKSLFGNSIKLSPSKVERFNKCNFAFFANDGLELKQRRKAEFSPLESGSIIHYVLEEMVKKYNGKGLDVLTLASIENEVDTLITKYLASRVSATDALGSRAKFLFARLCSSMARLLKHIGREFAQSEFSPIEFELPIGNSEKIKPLNLVTPSGALVMVEGIVDRVDVMEKDGIKYIRVVDYKSGRKDFRLEDVVHGLNLQMLLYLFTLSENGDENLKGAVPTGILYMPVRSEYSSLDRSATSQQAEEKLTQHWKMSGILLDDPEVLAGMEKDIAGIYIPAKAKKNGELSAYSSVATTAELGIIAGEVKGQIKKVASLILAGEIDNYPVSDIAYPTCDYCEYRSVCGYEEGDPVRIIEKMSKQDVIEKLEKGESNVGS